MKLEDFQSIINAHPLVDILEQTNDNRSNEADNGSTLHVVLVTIDGKFDKKHAPKESRNQPLE